MKTLRATYHGETLLTFRADFSDRESVIEYVATKGWRPTPIKVRHIGRWWPLWLVFRPRMERAAYALNWWLGSIGRGRWSGHLRIRIEPH